MGADVEISAIHRHAPPAATREAGLSRCASITVVARARKLLALTDPVVAGVIRRADIAVVARVRRGLALAAVVAAGVIRRADIAVVARVRRGLALAAAVAAGVIRRADIAVVARVRRGLVDASGSRNAGVDRTGVRIIARDVGMRATAAGTGVCCACVAIIAVYRRPLAEALVVADISCGAGIVVAAGVPREGCA